jgi:ribose transport system substrate-binding protein
MRRFGRWFAVLMLLTGLVACISCIKKNQAVIGVVPKGQSQVYWNAVHAGAAAAAQELGVDIRWNGPASETDPTGQIRIVDDFINQRVDGIVLAPTHGESLVPVVERAFQERIPVVIFDSGIRTEKYLTYVSTDNYKAGVRGARRMGAIAPGGSKIAVIGNVPGSVSTTERENGFRETIAREFPTLQIVEFQYGMSVQSKALAVAEDILAYHTDLAGIFCSNESATAGAVQAAKSKGVSGRVKIVGFDAAPTTVQDLLSGSLDATVVQHPFRMGYLGVKTLVESLRGTQPEKRIDTGATLVVRENLSDPAIRELLAPPVARYVR